jgi:hypothetical protein
MRVVFEIISGPEAGRKTTMGAGQQLRVGRTERADFSVPHDGFMSGVHFSLETDEAACYVEDLGSSNGTCVNGQRVVGRAVLHHGDEIQAGKTRFQVLLQGDQPLEAPAAASELPDGEPAPPRAGLAPVLTPLAQGRVAYTVEKCSSGLTLCRGNVEEIQPHDLASRLCQVYPVYLIVDFTKLPSGPPDGLESPAYLFDWLEPEAAATVSPVVLAQTDLLDWPALVEAGWGNDAVICLFSTQEKPALLEHLRRVIRTKPKQEDVSGGMIGYCWPSVMAVLLAYGTPEFVSQLLAGIEAVLVELPDLPETWQVYGGPQVPGLLDQFGFQQQPPEGVASQPSDDQA